MNILDGKAVSQNLKEQLKIKIADFEREFGRKITLAVVMAGDNPASAVYVRNKIKAAEYEGIKSLSFKLPSTISEAEVKDVVSALAEDKTVDGILVQLPLPEGIDESSVLSVIPPEKDVDGFTEINVGKLMLGKPCSAACTPKGIITLLKASGVCLSGKNAVVIGRSNIVGKPLAMLLLKENCTVTVCHSKTENLAEICKRADILVAALGRSRFVGADMVKQGAVVVDVGINRTESGLTGDVDFENVKDIASMITPVPGGVGPMTIATLMENTYECALRREKR